MKLKGKIALITGGTKGIGKAIAESMMAEGIHVAITGRESASSNEIANALNEKYKNAQALGIAADVRSMEDMDKAIAITNKELGHVDYLIANAGIGHFASIDEMSSEQWQQTIDVNLTGVFNSVKASLDNLKKTQGYLITIASLAGTNFFAKGAAYNASKFGLVGMTQAMMLDLRKYDIKVSTIMPGSVSTYFNNNEPSEKDAWKIQPEDLGQITIDLLKMHPRTLPSKVEVRPSRPDKK